MEIPIGEILAFFTGLLILVFIALIVSNLSGTFGGTKILDGNIQPLFDHQTVLEDSNWGNIQTPNNDYQTKMNVKNSISGIDDIVAVAETADGYDKATVEKGSITFTIDTPSDMFIHYTDGMEIGTITAVSIGGYFPCEGETQTVMVSQEKDPRAYKARIEWDFTPQYDPCYTYTYSGVIVADGEWSLMSSYYPVVDDTDCWTNWDTDPVRGTIPGKKVDFSLISDWCGCDDFNTQGFTILPLRDNHQFPK